MRQSSARYQPISEYALIGDCHSTALVHTSGSIDWACLLRFDSTSIFGRILDADKGGYWRIGPACASTITRHYCDNTMVLETDFETPDGKVRLIDFFAMHRGGRTSPHHQLTRIVEGLSGEVEVEFDMVPRFDYGAFRPWLRHHREDGTYSGVGGNEAFTLTAGCDLKVDAEDVAIRGTVHVKAGQRVRFALASSQPHAMEKGAISPEAIDERLDETREWWLNWVRNGKYEGAFPREVTRSALVLKALSNAQTGAIIAAPTTSLPEQLGGTRNWDYRYCWIRDAALTMSALYVIGHHEVAEGFKAFIERSTAGSAEDTQIMYACFGERRIPETELTHLEGYMGSKPVRIGNGAYHQKQHDIYGELLDASYLWRQAGHPIPEDEWNFLRSLVNAACDVWRTPDQGIWEVRSESKHFVHSKVMCWVAIDRGIQLAEQEDKPCDLEHWKQQWRAIKDEVFDKGIDPERNCFVQHYDTKNVDASLLLLAHLGFVSGRDERMVNTVKAVMDDLLEDGFVQRYRTDETDDGVNGKEGTFLICTFWLVDALLLQGRLDEAVEIFERTVSVANDVGLLAEEYDPVRKIQLGNFPQAYSHMALINSAYMIWLSRQHKLGRATHGAGDRVQHLSLLPGPRRRTLDDIHG